MKKEKQSKNILLFTDNYPFGKGEAFLETELKYLSDYFQNITLLPLGKNKSNNKRLIPENLTVYDPVFSSFKNKTELLRKGLFNATELKPFITEFFSKEVWKNLTKFRNWFTHLLLVRASVSYYRKKKIYSENFDILYFYWGLRWSQVLPFLKSENKKIIVRFHGSDLYEEINNNYIPFRKLQIEKINSFIFVSEMGKNYLVRKFPEISTSTYIARLGTEDYGIGPYSKSETINIVSCSNLVALKQVDIIAQSLNFTKSKVRWTHIGDGPEMEKILSIISKLPEFVEVKLMGHLDRNLLYDYYKNNQVNIFVNVSMSEGVPVSIMEAMSFGIPIIASDVGGTNEIVDHKVGYLISSKIKPEELAAKLEELVSDKNYYLLRENSRNRWLERCNANKVFPEFANYLSTL
jgi:colanic acid/amylovoran biosynthesis glycosyltransferase